MSTVTLTADSFQDTVTDNDIVMVDFWAEWCGPCKSFAPVYEATSESNPDIVFGKVDTEAEQALAGRLAVEPVQERGQPDAAGHGIQLGQREALAQLALVEQLRGGGCGGRGGGLLLQQRRLEARPS